MNIRSTLIANDWKQGSVLKENFAKILYPEHEGYVVVVSQDCDLVYHDFDLEPCFETLLFNGGAKVKKKYEGKDPRVFRGNLEVTGEKIGCETRIASRGMHPRNLLLEHEAWADAELTPASLKKIKYWLAKKYDRYGRPEAFDAALKPVKALDRIEKIMAANEEILDGLYLKIDPSCDISDGEKYRVKMILLYDLDKKTNGSSEREIADKATSAAQEIEMILSEVDIIDLDSEDDEDIGVRAEAKQQLYVSVLNSYHYFDYDYLSADIDPELKTLPNI